MSQVHFTLCGKGGVGKTLVASLIAQYLSSKEKPMAFITAHSIGIGENYDPIFNRIIEEDKNFVVDPSSISALQLRQYVIDCDLVNLLPQFGKRAVMHAVISDDSRTHINLASLIKEMPESAPIIIWLNEFCGRIEGFEETEIYLNNRERIHGIIRIENRSPCVPNPDLTKMLSANLTFDEAEASPLFGIMEKSRLTQIKKNIYRQLEAVV